MKSSEHIESFSPELKKILENEIKLGNEIVETSKGWPHEKSIIIFLKLPFFDTYTVSEIEYRDIDDVHYWKAEYFDKINSHILACRF